MGKEIKTGLNGSQEVEGDKRKEARSAVEKLSKNSQEGHLQVEPMAAGASSEMG